MPSDSAAPPFTCFELSDVSVLLYYPESENVRAGKTLENIYAKCSSITESRKCKDLAHGHTVAESETEPHLLAPDPD